MIRVRAKRHPQGGYELLEISGHASYAEYGKDIVVQVFLHLPKQRYWA